MARRKFRHPRPRFEMGAALTRTKATFPPAMAADSIEAAVAHAWQLLTQRPTLASRQAHEILKIDARNLDARLILGISLRLGGDPAAARDLMSTLVREHGDSGRAWLELGLAEADLGDVGAALTAGREAVRLEPDLPDVWRFLGDVLTQAGDPTSADVAYLRYVEAAVGDAQLMLAADALAGTRLDAAEPILRDRLRVHPTDVVAIRMLAELGARLGRYDDAAALLTRCLELAPGFTAARRNYAGVLHRQGKGAEALVEVERLLAAEPSDPSYRTLQAAVLTGLGEYAASIEIYEDLLTRHADQPVLWLNYGHALKTVGRQDDGVEAYRRCIALAPAKGEAWWSLANLKTVRFVSEQVEAMQAALDQARLGDEDRLHLHYALGKALEDGERFDESFDHYAQGAAIQKARLGYDALETAQQVRKTAAIFGAELFQSKAGLGDPACDPIFVVGLPRSGSTLIEQILSSHPEVEGTMELPEIAAIARRIGEGDAGYPAGVADLDGKALAAFGARFLERTQVQRKLGRQFFIDKMPNNWLHVGLIRLILPNAKIVDARRHPLATCFSAFKQHFARGQNFSYDLHDLGHYYRGYVRLMDHFDQVQPGKVHRVIYEDMVEDTEAEVRRLLDHCGLSFDPACLRFYDNERAVRTASSEQVRQPIFRDGLEQWRNYSAHLGPLEAALGNALEAWRGEST